MSPAQRGRRVGFWGNRGALLAALGVDNFGSGLFLPLAVVYVTRVVGLPLAVAGTVISLGTLAGLAVPPITAVRTGSPGADGMTTQELVPWLRVRWAAG